MDLFEQQWQTYRSVIENDWMEHRGVTAACSSALQTWMAQHPERHGQARLLDLGCGDMAQMAPVFRALPLGAFVGVDLTEQVLPMAASALGDVPFTAEFHHRDVQRFVEAEGEPFDLVHASFVLHHLSDDEKARFLSTLRGRIRRDGAFLWIDVFCEPGESREDYLARYVSRIRSGWDTIAVDAREAVVTHITAYDFPADRSAIVDVAADSGWHWEWVWQGSHRAEAAALLTPTAPRSANCSTSVPRHNISAVSMFD